ncbi:MAG: hypothetical protein M3Y08_09395, partial [Fibrobacterota bacterium]|nr:hypothetical protein [Fibrobacterota bacterium]
MDILPLVIFAAVVLGAKPPTFSETLSDAGSAWDENGFIHENQTLPKAVDPPIPAAASAPADSLASPHLPTVRGADAHHKEGGHAVNPSPKPAPKKAPKKAPKTAAHGTPQLPEVFTAPQHPHGSPEPRANAGKKPASKPHAAPMAHGTVVPDESSPKSDPAQKPKSGAAHKAEPGDTPHDADQHGKNKAPNTTPGKEAKTVLHPHDGAKSGDHDVTGKHEGSHDESKPQLQPKPDTAFARSVDWNKGTAEILAYEVKRRGLDGEGKYQGRLITERMFLKPNGLTDR